MADTWIEEIMAKLNKGRPMSRMTGSNASSEGRKAKRQKPPQNLEEFLTAERIYEWPQRLTSEDVIDLKNDGQTLGLGSVDEFIEELKGATPVDMKMLQDLEERLGLLEGRLNVYASHMLQDKIAPDDDGNLINNTFITQPKNADKHSVQFSQTAMNEVHELPPEIKRNIRNWNFPGFCNGELTELPGQLEAPQILNRITKAQDFSPGFKKFWKKIFQSEASVAIMQDAFWWIFIENFDKKKKRAQSRLFDRIADSFVALFTSINPEVKDKFFMAYPDCLAQTLYAAFFEAFPDSEKDFQEEFRQYLANTTSEWVSGVRAPAQSWRKWDEKILDIKSTKSRKAGTMQRRLQEVEIQPIDYKLDLTDFTKIVQKLGDRDVSRAATTLTGGLSSKEPTTLTNKTKTTLDRLTINDPKPKQPVESHQIGPGPEMERILFSLKAQSPLVAHYLLMRQLKDCNDTGRKIRRTEIVKLPQDAPTYRQVINDAVNTSDKLSTEYQKICEQTNKEIQKINKQQRDLNRWISNLQRDLSFTKNSLEVKMISDQILDKWDLESSELILTGAHKLNMDESKQTDEEQDQ